MKTIDKRWIELALNDDTVYTFRRMIEQGETDDTFPLVEALVKQKDRLMERVMELERIAPFGIRDEKGNVNIWRCPAEHIPIRE